MNWTHLSSEIMKHPKGGDV